MHVRVSGPFDHANVVLADRPLVLGRDPHCEVVLDDPGVSGRHALLQRTPAGVEVVDLGSANGVFVDGQLVRKAMVVPGHVIRIGATELTFDLRDEVHARVNETLSLPRMQAALPAPPPCPTPPYVGPPVAPRPLTPPKRRSAVPIVLLVLFGMTALVAAASFGVWRWLEAGGTLGAGSPSARPGASAGSPVSAMPNASAGIPDLVFDRNPFEDE